MKKKNLRVKVTGFKRRSVIQHTRGAMNTERTTRRSCQAGGPTEANKMCSCHCGVCVCVCLWSSGATNVLAASFVLCNKVRARFYIGAVKAACVHFDDTSAHARSVCL